jgi:hypothetical protein
MIATTAYILISTLISRNDVVAQSTATFIDKPSCESAAVRQDFVLKSMDTKFAQWNLTCHPYQLTGEKK